MERQVPRLRPRLLARGGAGRSREVAYRLTGSSDLYESNGRKPYASVNFITAHDGFTLRDLVSYNEKHNEANGEGNADGDNHNRSWNCGAEGPTDDAAVLELRARQTRNFLATLLLSQGIPMVLAGDELGRTQGGNNNAYCQDNEVSWIDWEHGGHRAGRVRERPDRPAPGPPGAAPPAASSRAGPSTAPRSRTSSGSRRPARSWTTSAGAPRPPARS